MASRRQPQALRRAVTWQEVERPSATVARRQLVGPGSGT